MKGVNKVSYNFTFTIRCESERFENFKVYCKKANKEYQDVIREVMEAVPEGRFKLIQKDEEKRAMKGIYK